MASVGSLGWGRGAFSPFGQAVFSSGFRGLLCPLSWASSQTARTNPQRLQTPPLHLGHSGSGRGSLKFSEDGADHPFDYLKTVCHPTLSLLLVLLEMSSEGGQHYRAYVDWERPEGKKEGGLCVQGQGTGWVEASVGTQASVGTCFACQLAVAVFYGPLCAVTSSFLLTLSGAVGALSPFDR